MSSSTIESNKRAVQQFFDAMNTGDVQVIVDSYADDGRLQTKGNTLISGTFSKDQIAQSAGGIFEVFPEGIRFTILSMVAEGDKVAVEATGEGLHVSGQVYTNEYHFLFEWRAGKLVRLTEYLDTERVTDILCAGQRPAAGDTTR